MKHAIYRQVRKRPPPFTVQMVYWTEGGAKQTMVSVGMSGMESYQLGPYDGYISLGEALHAVAADIQLDNKFGSHYDPPI